MFIVCDCKDRFLRFVSLFYFWVDLVFIYCIKSFYFYENVYIVIRCFRLSNLFYEFLFLKYVLRWRYVLIECNLEIILFYFFFWLLFRSWLFFEILVFCWNIFYYLYVNFVDLVDRSLLSWIGNFWDFNNVKKIVLILKKRILNLWF